MARLLIVFGAIVTLALGALFFLICTDNSIPPVVLTKLKEELPKLLAQLIVITIIGGFISFLIQDHKRRQDLEDHANEFRKATLNNLIRAYSNAKKVRRRLRAKANQSGGKFLQSDYEEAMRDINEAQIELEIVKREIETNKNYFKDYETLYDNVKKMEGFLRELHKEYEGESCKYTIAQFINDSEGSSMWGEFFTPFDETLERMRENILSPPSLSIHRRSSHQGRLSG